MSKDRNYSSDLSTQIKEENTSSFIHYFLFKCLHYFFPSNKSNTLGTKVSFKSINLTIHPIYKHKKGT